MRRILTDPGSKLIHVDTSTKRILVEGACTDSGIYGISSMVVTGTGIGTVTCYESPPGYPTGQTLTIDINMSSSVTLNFNSANFCEDSPVIDGLGGITPTASSAGTIVGYTVHIARVVWDAFPMSYTQCHLSCSFVGDVTVEVDTGSGNIFQPCNFGADTALQIVSTPFSTSDSFIHTGAVDGFDESLTIAMNGSFS
jgi:hypothetical protein